MEITERADERRMLFMQSARIYEENLSEPDRAIEQLRALLDETPGDGEALGDLDRILTAEGRQADLVEVLDARAAGREGLRRRATSWLSVPRAWSRPSSATSKPPSDATPRSWPGRPTHAGAREALYAIARGDDYRLAAVAVLEPI